MSCAPSTSVLVLEPDARLARLVARYLAGHGVKARLAAGHAELQAALMLAQYTCVIAGPEFEDDAVIADLCLDAGVTLLVTARFSGPDMLRRIDTIRRVRSDL